MGCKNLVDTQLTISEAKSIIIREIDLCGDTSGDYRVPPLMITRLSRGGKSTILRLLFDEIKLIPEIVLFSLLLADILCVEKENLIKMQLFD